MTKHHVVYVIELDPQILEDDDGFRDANPDRSANHSGAATSTFTCARSSSSPRIRARSSTFARASLMAPRPRCFRPS